MPVVQNREFKKADFGVVRPSKEGYPHPASGQTTRLE